MYYLLKNPEALRKLRAEIDEVVGDGPVQYEHLSKLPYLIGGHGFVASQVPRLIQIRSCYA